MQQIRAIVVFGDVTGSRRDSAEAADWLRQMVDELDDAFAGDRLAPFGFTQGDELQALLSPDADPFGLILRVGLHPRARQVRWSVVAGTVDPGSGPATQRTGQAFLAARDQLEAARADRDAVRAVSGDPASDAILADIAPLLGVLLGDLTDRQRTVANLMLVGGRRQADAADELGIRRPTVSVLADRARVREIGRLARALNTLLRSGADRAHGTAGAS